MKLTQSQLRTIIREELSEITQLPTDLDDFLALLGNRVISGDVTREEADKVVNNIEGYLA